MAGRNPLRQIGATVAPMDMRTARPGPKVVEQFYVSPDWRALLARIKRQRGNKCEKCGSTHRVIGDHIIERKDGGAELDERNVMLLCQSCHNTKTALVAKERLTRR